MTLRFLLDVCTASRSLHSFLLSQGHDVLSALDVDPTASDDELLAIASTQRRVVVTEDKDFGELVFVHRRPHAGIIRFSSMTVGEQVEAMRELLRHYSAEIEEQRIVVVTPNRIRVRRHD